MDKVALRTFVAAGVNVTVMARSRPGFWLDPQADFAAEAPGADYGTTKTTLLVSVPLGVTT